MDSHTTIVEKLALVVWSLNNINNCNKGIDGRKEKEIREVEAQGKGSKVEGIAIKAFASKGKQEESSSKGYDYIFFHLKPELW